MRVKTMAKFLPVLASIVFLASCQKEVSFDSPIIPGTGGTGGNNTNNIVGDYDFVGMTAQTLSSVTITQAGQTMKTETVAAYATENNTGTVKITSNEMFSSGVGYSIDTTMNNKTYINGLLIDDSDIPFTYTLPATNSNSTYVRNSADSITMTGGLGIPDPSGTTQVGDVGAKLSWHGDTLYMKVSTTFSRAITQQGIPATLTGTLTGISKLKKR